MRRNSNLRNTVVGLVCIALPALIVFQLSHERQKPEVSEKPKQRSYAIEGSQLTAWWDEVPQAVRRVARPTGESSNIRREDYSGPESCRKCHKQNYDSWSQHPHRWMNALATDDHVKGAFSDDAQIAHLGGTGSFLRVGDKYHMRLERDGVRRDFHITRTIGSRFFQYYVGRQIAGPSPYQHPAYEQDHVLPYGYWLGQKEWVPVVHVYDRDDAPDKERTDPFDLLSPPRFATYSVGCNGCHTTFPVGDQFVRQLRVAGRHAPFPLHFAMADYLGETHPELWSAERNPNEMADQRLLELINTFEKYPAPEHAVTLGISCEACHLGAKDHAEGRLKKPVFFPQSPHLFAETATGEPVDCGRTRQNINWACGRCHAGERPYYAGGMSTWNSTEYSDAVRGGCYSQLTCVHCHNPHQKIGPKWSLTADQDDALCLKCHQELAPDPARLAHTHHPLGTSGSRCMNCHMPRINEGLQDMVRTHTICSPTAAAMIEANQPNACNMCHVEKPIDWTLSHLKSWYGATYNAVALRRKYPQSRGPVAVGWLHSENQAVRLSAADALFRNQAKWSLEHLIDALDDAFLINRQFARVGLEKLLDIDLVEFGYRFYMTRKERQKPLERLRAKWLESE
ncbi:MAG: cytochrome c3 family protein, partial [Planctomycetaceae bacterium]